MELLQWHAGLDAQLFIENLAQSVIRRERVALPPTPVKRKHPLRLKPFAEWVSTDELIEFRHDRDVSAQCQIGVDF
jgi:hypothetical protein